MPRGGSRATSIGGIVGLPHNQRARCRKGDDRTAMGERGGWARRSIKNRELAERIRADEANIGSQSGVFKLPDGGRRLRLSAGLSHMEFSMSRPCERRDPSVNAIALIAAARTLVSALEQRPFFTFGARGDGSLRSQGRPAERLCEATTIG